MKGVILKIHPASVVIDLTHGIEPQNILQAAFLIKKSFSEFPVGTIHVCVVDPGVGSNRRILGLSWKHHVFIGPDNGCFSGIFSEMLDSRGIIDGCYQIINTELTDSPRSATFHGRDIFAPCAAMLARGNELTELGKPVSDPVIAKGFEGFTDSTGIEGSVVHIDHFGNIITNIESAAVSRKLQTAEINGCCFEKPVGTFSDVPIGSRLIYIGSFGTFELAVRDGSAAECCGAKLGDRVKLFLNSED